MYIQASEWDWLVRHELAAKMEAIDQHLADCAKKLVLLSPSGEAVCCVRLCVV